MDLSNSIISFIDALGVVQGVLLAILLMIIHIQKNKSLLFLGIFIFLFSLEPIPNILHDLGILNTNPNLELLPVGFHFLAYPFLLIYVEKISIFNNKSLSYWTLIPGVFEFIAATFVFLLSYAKKLEIKDSSFAIIYFFLGLCYSVYIMIIILKRITFHTKEVENQYTFLDKKTLNWCKWFVYTNIIFLGLNFFNFFIDSHVWYAWISVLNVILIYWVSFKGIQQEKIIALIWIDNDTSKEKKIIDAKQEIELEETSELDLSTSQHIQDFMTKDEAENTFEILDDYVKNSECYKNDTLTIIDIAEAIQIHPKRISYAVNTIKSLNFNNYINSYRVALAKQILKSSKASTLSIEGIGVESGFRSKTTFYNAFKKNVNMTPAQYKNSKD
ncbi:AraC family transcriptional regulator [uncultured Tenacibaculum sp.]|uniref:helix-turn-helix domain-containing protein n=1 Tax=uncultured Tenacibaculum sp. TaxID=174713 RepID=UPI00262B2A63|nr:helix-turn-helix domain-containing protein [uncultured Tenacibaculum sp.]